MVEDFDKNTYRAVYKVQLGGGCAEAASCAICATSSAALAGAAASAPSSRKSLLIFFPSPFCSVDMQVA